MDIENALIIASNGSERVAIAPDGAMDDTGEQAGMQVNGSVFLTSTLSVGGDINLEGTLKGGNSAIVEIADNLHVKINVNAQSIFADNVYATGVHAQNFYNTSDINAKSNIISVDNLSILKKLAILPVSAWTFKNEPSVTHIGPMAQHFKESFRIGIDDKHISSSDEVGVALAAIKGLNQKVEDQAAELKSKQSTIESLTYRLAQLEVMLSNLCAQRRP